MIRFRRNTMNYELNTRRPWRLFVLLAALLVTSASALAENQPTERTISKALNTQWNKAFNSGKPHLVAALYAENAKLSPGNGEVLVGRAAIESLFRGFIKNGVHEHKIEIIDVQRDGNMMYEIAKWTAFGADEAQTKTAFGGIFVNIFQKDAEGEWKSHLHLWNSAN